MHEPHSMTLMLAQDTVLPPSGGAQPTATPTDAGTLDPAGSAQGTGPTQQPSGFGNLFLPIMILLLVTMIVFSMLGQKRDRKKREALINSIKKHDRVQTIGGVIGSVVEVKPDYVVLKVDESSNTRITFARSAIQQVLNVSPEVAVAAKDAAAKEAAK